jgi:GNAT superfamily N-acetyltransferase
LSASTPLAVALVAVPDVGADAAVAVAPRGPATTFRLATAGDALCLGVLGTQVFLDTYALQGIRPAIAREALSHFSTAAMSDVLARPDAFIVVAECDGHLVGYAQVTIDATHALAPEAHAAELRRLYVQERFTGRGIGRDLVRQAEGYAAAHGASLLWLTTWIGNTRALAFYPRCGYAERGATVYEFQGEAYENRLFARPLAGGAPSGR